MTTLDWLFAIFVLPAAATLSVCFGLRLAHWAGLTPIIKVELPHIKVEMPEVRVNLCSQAVRSSASSVTSCKNGSEDRS